MEFYDANSDRKMTAQMFSASTKQLSVMRNACSHYGNMFDGVKHKVEYRIRLGFTHFPISTDITNDGKISRLITTSARGSCIR